MFSQQQIFLKAFLQGVWCSPACFCVCSFEDMRQASAARQLGLLSSDQPETLVLYTYSNSDPEYERNLHFFVEHGMAEGDGCDYVIIVQEVGSVHISLTYSTAHAYCQLQSAFSLVFPRIVTRSLHEALSRQLTPKHHYMRFTSITAGSLTGSLPCPSDTSRTRLSTTPSRCQLCLVLLSCIIAHTC